MSKIEQVKNELEKLLKGESYTTEICLSISTDKNKRVYRLTEQSLKEKTAIEIATELYNRSFVFDKDFAYAADKYKGMIDKANNENQTV